MTNWTLVNCVVISYINQPAESNVAANGFSFVYCASANYHDSTFKDLREDIEKYACHAEYIPS